MEDPSMKILGFFVLFFALVAQAEVKVLQIGDSQSAGIFGSYWHDKLASHQEIKLTLFARGGSTSESWLHYETLKGDFRKISSDGNSSRIKISTMPALNDLLQKYSPDVVIIQLGGNMVRWSDESIRLSVKELISQIKEKSSQCLWIAPPNGHARPEPRFSEFYPVLKDAVVEQGCGFFDSRKYTTYPEGKGDGIHFDSLGLKGRRLVKKWVNTLWKDMSPWLD
jgi:GDSL-like Lipase/Acylhydrolase family